MDSEAARQIDIALAHRITKESTAEETAAAAFALWQAIDSSLSPILGPQGFDALCQRSLHLAARRHPWLRPQDTGLQAPMNGETLRSAIAQQANQEAAHGSQAFFLTFHELLASLIGPSLTERLLRMAWAQPSRGPPPTEPHP